MRIQSSCKSFIQSTIQALRISLKFLLKISDENLSTRRLYEVYDEWPILEVPIKADKFSIRGFQYLRLEMGSLNKYWIYSGF